MIAVIAALFLPFFFVVMTMYLFLAIGEHLVRFFHDD